MAYRCKICDSEAESEGEMRRHLDVHSTKQVYRYAYEETGGSG